MKFDDEEIARVAKAYGVTPEEVRRELARRGGDPDADPNAVPQDQPPRPGIGLGRAVGQGALRGVGQIGGLADLITGLAFNPTGPNPSLAATAQEEASRRGLDAPRSELTGPERVAESLTAGAIGAIPTAVLPGGTVPSVVRRMLFEMASGATGGLAADAAEDRGAGALGQFAAGVAGGLAPSVGRAVLRRATPARAQARRAERLARRAGRREAKALPAARADFQQAVGGNVDDALAELRREAAGGLGPGKARTSAVLEDVSPQVTALERSVVQKGGRAGSDLSNEISRLRKLNEEAIQEASGRAFPGGRPGPATLAFEEAQEQLRNRTQAAYRAAGDLDGIPTQGLRVQVDAIRREAIAEGVPEDLPASLVSRIEKLGETTNLKRLRGLRTKLGERAAIAQRAGKGNQARYLHLIRESIDDTLETVAQEGGAEEVGALRRALDAARDEFRLVGRETSGSRALGSTRAFVEVENLEKGFQKFILGAKSPSEELGRLRILIGDNPEAWAGVQGLMRDVILGEDLARLGSRNAESLLRKHRLAFDAIHGSGATHRALEFNRRVRRLRAGSAGTRAESTVTGSAIRDLSQFAENAGIMASMGRGDARGALGNAIASVVRRLRRSDVTEQMKLQLLNAALTDPNVAIGFLEPLEPARYAIWEQAVKRTMAPRVAVRATQSAQEERQQ